MIFDRTFSQLIKFCRFTQQPTDLHALEKSRNRFCSFALFTVHIRWLFCMRNVYKLFTHFISHRYIRARWHDTLCATIFFRVTHTHTFLVLKLNKWQYLLALSGFFLLLLLLVYASDCATSQNPFTAIDWRWRRRQTPTTTNKLLFVVLLFMMLKFIKLFSWFNVVLLFVYSSFLLPSSCCIASKIQLI